jgi:hypothetical protein
MQAGDDGRAPDYGKAPPGTEFKASLLLRILPPSAPATQTGDRLITNLKSPGVLNDVVVNMDLAGRWSTGAETSLSRLTAMTRVVPSENSAMTGTLVVYSPDGNEAGEIADALVAAFKSSLEKSESDQTSRLAEPVNRQIKALTDSVERARNQMLACMNSRQIVDYGFLDTLNGKPGVILPELEASLDPDIKVAWFSHQLETLHTLPKENAAGYLAGAVLPFDHQVTKLCQVWLDLVPTAVAVAETPGSSLSGVFAYKRDETEAAIEAYKLELQKWITKTEQDLRLEDPGPQSRPGTDRSRQEEYRQLKQHYEAETDALKALRENAARLFGNDAPLYVPPVLVLKKSVERVPH